MWGSGSGTSQRSASAGVTFRCSSRSRRSSNISASMRSDHASIPTLGSRLVGLLSIIMTSVLGSGAWEQERRGSTHAPRINKKTLVRKRIVTLKRVVVLSEAKDVLFARTCAASCIRNLSEDRPPLRSRSRRYMARPPMPRFMREQGKGHCLLRFRRKAEFIREMDADSHGRDLIAQHAHQRRIFRASARDDHLLIGAISASGKLRQHEAPD